MSSRDPVAGARIRLTLQFGAMCAALLLGVAISLHAYVRRALLGAFDAAHDLAVRSVLECVESGATGAVVKESAFVEEFDELNVTLGVVAVRVWSADGRILAQAGTDHVALTRSGPAREMVGAGEHLTVVRRAPFGSGDASGIVGVSRSSGEIAEELAALRRGLLLVIPFGFLGALAIGWIMAGRSLKPVRLAFEQHRAFMADASHEIRTPLSIVQTQAEVHLQDATADPEEARVAFGVIARTAAQLSGLVNDLLFLARADAAPLAPRRMVFDIETLIEETVESFEPSAKARGSRLVYASGADVEVNADPGQVGRLVAILIDNAIRHADPGDIHVAIDPRGRHLDIRVSDCGPGVPRNLLPRIFDRFVRGDNYGQDARGHGLGLAIARSIVTSHGGSIRIVSNDRHGTTAVATLPIVHVQSGARMA